ncbi:hypothetical protein OROHE_024882 [Orobanche hederae]
MGVVCLGVLGLFFVMPLALSAAHSPAPSPAVDCSDLVLDVASCLPYVSAVNTTAKPETTCCSGLIKVLGTDAQCLCDAFRSSTASGMELNMKHAFNLPDACNVSDFSVKNYCHLTVSTGPSAAPVPALSPSAIPLSPPATPVSDSPSADSRSNEISPSLGPGISGFSSRAVSIEPLLLTAVAALFFTSAY